MTDPQLPQTHVACNLADCVHFMTDEDGRVCCRHPDKPMHMRVEPCPLYRMDWKRRSEITRRRPTEE